MQRDDLAERCIAVIGSGVAVLTAAERLGARWPTTPERVPVSC